MALVSLEFAVRASTWGYLFVYPNFVLTARTVLAERDGGRYVHDPELGHVPRAGYAAAGTTIEADGLRRTGEQVAGAPILAVGDSFTYGDEVNDGQTWPAQLQLLTGRRVLNAGVSGYGFDQIVLRAEQLAAKLQAVGDRGQLHRRRHPAHRDAPPVERRQALLRDRRRQACTARRAGAAARRSRQHHAQLLAVDAGLLATCSTSSCAASTCCTTGTATTSASQAPGTGERLSCLLTERLAELQKHERRQGHRAGRVRSRGVGRSRLRRRAAPHDQGPARLRGQERPCHHRQLRRPGRHRRAAQSSTSPGT